MSTPFVVVAKAGGSDEGAENTVQAILATLSIGDETGIELAVEVDVRLTSDHQLVVIHDENLERTTNGRGRVAAHTLSQLRQLQAGPRAERIPTLEETIEVTRGHRLVIEPHVGDAAMLEALVRCFARAGQHQRERLVLASEQTHLVRALRRRCPELRTAATAAEAKRKLVLDSLGLAALAPRWPLWVVPMSYRGFNVLSDAFLTSARQRAGQVWTYVVNRSEQAHRLRNRGVAGIITTQPRSVIEGLQMFRHVAA
jgi:glycerophosphoryl diester phosphodiesterase